MCITRPNCNLFNSCQDRWRPPAQPSDLQCDAIKGIASKARAASHRLPPSRVAVERGSERESGRTGGPTLPFVCVHARAHAAPPRGAAIPSLWESHDRDLGGRMRQREREGRRKSLHSIQPVCCKQASAVRVESTYTADATLRARGLRQSSKC